MNEETDIFQYGVIFILKVQGKTKINHEEKNY